MIVTLVGTISSSLSRAGLVSYGAAGLWGLMSVALSPCHLGAIPLIVGFIDYGERASRSRALLLPLLFAFGLLVTHGCPAALADKRIVEGSSLAQGRLRRPRRRRGSGADHSAANGG